MGTARGNAQGTPSTEMNPYRTFRVLAAAAACALLLQPAGAVAQGQAGPAQPAGERPSLRLLTEENPPFNYTDPKTGRLTGIAGELVPLLMQEAGIAYTIEMKPWSEAMAAATAEPGTCLFAANLLPERLPLFKWVTPLAQGGYGFFVRAESDVRVATLAELRARPIGVQAGGPVERFLKEHGFKVVATPLEEQFAMLSRGEVDVVASGIRTGPWHARRAGVSARPVYRLPSSDLGLACNRGTPDELMARLNRALGALQVDGTFDRITNAYQ